MNITIGLVVAIVAFLPRNEGGMYAPQDIIIGILAGINLGVGAVNYIRRLPGR